MPLFGPPNVDAMKAKRDVKGLFRLMTSDPGDLGKRAAQALVDIGVPVVKPLLALVDKAPAESKAQEAVTRVLHAIGSPVVEPLLAVLKAPDDPGQVVAIHTLGAMDDPRAGEAFLELLRDRSSAKWLTRAVAAGYVGRFVGIRAQEPLLSILRESHSVTVLMGAQLYARALGEVGDGQAVEMLAALTRTRFANSYVDTPAQARAAAAQALGKVAGRLKDAPESAQAEAALVDLLKDPNMALRGYAALALGQIIGHHAVEPLLAALEDTDPLVRSAAAFGLRGSMDPRKVEPLIAQLTASDKDMRANAAEGLGTGMDPRAVEPLVACLRDQEPAVRRSAVTALLGFIGDDRIVQPLIARLSDVSAEVRSQAALVLAFCGRAAVEPLIDSLSDPSPDVRWQAAFSLGQLKDARAVEPLIAALQDTDRAVRYHCVQSLGQIGTPQAITVVQAALGDPDELVRHAAQEAVQSTSRAPQPEEPGAAAPQAPAQTAVSRAAELPAPASQPGLSVDTAPPEPAAGIPCPHCGTMNRVGRRYCGQCGSSLQEAGAPPTSPATSSQVQERSRAPAPASLAGGTPSQADTIQLLREIVEHVRPSPDDTCQEERLALLVSRGPAVAPAVTGAIWSVIHYEREPFRLANAGLLCKALGEIGGDKAFDALIRFAGLDSTVPANHAARLGAIRGLGLLGDPRAEQTLTSALQDADEQVREAAAQAIDLLRQPQETPSVPDEATAPAAPPATAATAPARTELPVDTKDFYHEEWNFSIAYPADWQVIYQDEPAGSWMVPIAVGGRETGGGRPCFMVNARRGEILQGSSRAPVYSTGPDGQFMKMPSTPEEYIDVNRTSLQDAFPGFRFISAEAIRLADKPAAKLVYSYDGQRGRITEESVTLFGVGVTFQFICEMPSAHYAAYQPVLQRILDSFRIGRALPKEAAIAEAPSDDVEAEQTPKQWYNQGVELYRSGEFRQAMTMFERCCASGEYQMQAAYARALCQRELSQEIQIPPELIDRTEEAGPVYLATNLACYLGGKGHAVALTKQGRTSEVRARIDGAEYIISIVQGFGLGGFFHMAWRKEGDRTIPLADSSANPRPSAADRFVISTLEQLSSLPPQSLPEAGFRTALEAMAQPEAAAPAEVADRREAPPVDIQTDERAANAAIPTPVARTPQPAPVPLSRRTEAVAFTPREEPPVTPAPPLVRLDLVSPRGPVAVQGDALVMSRGVLSPKTVTLPLDALRLVYLFLPTQFKWHFLQDSEYQYQFVNLDALSEERLNDLRAALAQQPHLLLRDFLFVLADYEGHVARIPWKQLADDGVDPIEVLSRYRAERQARFSRWIEANPGTGFVFGSASLNAAGVAGGRRFIPWNVLQEIKLVQHRSLVDRCNVSFLPVRTGEFRDIVTSVPPRQTEACIAETHLWRSLRPSPGSSAPIPRPSAAPNSALAAISMVAAISSWLLLPVVGAIGAVITGHLAKREIRKGQGVPSGSGMATAGLALGYANLALFLAILVGSLAGTLAGRSPASASRPARTVVYEVVAETFTPAPRATVAVQAQATATAQAALAVQQATADARATQAAVNAQAARDIQATARAQEAAAQAAATAQAVRALVAAQAAQATATAQAAALAGSQWPIVLADDFSENTNNWPIVSVPDQYADITRAIADGKYRWDMEAVQGVHSTAGPGASAWYSDLAASVDAQAISAPAKHSYGIAFRTDGANQYFFGVYHGQYVALSVAQNGQWTVLLGLTPCSSLRASGSNRITVIAQGSHFTFLVNGALVAEADDTRLSRGGVALAADLFEPGDRATFEFDNLEVRAADGAVPAQATPTRVSAATPTPVAAPTKAPTVESSPTRAAPGEPVVLSEKLRFEGVPQVVIPYLDGQAVTLADLELVNQDTHIAGQVRYTRYQQDDLTLVIYITVPDRLLIVYLDPAQSQTLAEPGGASANIFLGSQGYRLQEGAGTGLIEFSFPAEAEGIYDLRGTQGKAYAFCVRGRINSSGVLPGERQSSGVFVAASNVLEMGFGY